MWTFGIYQDKKGGWRWSLAAANKKIVADSAEAYKTKASVVRALRRFMAQIAHVEKFAVAEVEK